MYKLYKGTDGGNYYEAGSAETPEELKELMDELDKEYIRWYLEGPDGEPDYTYRICRVHQERLNAHMKTIILPGLNLNGFPKEIKK